MSPEDLQRQIELMRERQAKIQANLDSFISEMRCRFAEMALSNEVTRNLANKIASLELENRQGMTRLAQKRQRN